MTGSSAPGPSDDGGALVDAHGSSPKGVVSAIAACTWLPVPSDLAAPSQSNSGGGQPAATPGAGGSGTTGQPTLPNGTPANTYLIRTLSVTLVVNRPLDAEHQVTQDVLSKDPQAQGAGEQISQQSDGSYTVAITFAVTRPPHVDIDEIVIRPVAQATVSVVARKV